MAEITVDNFDRRTNGRFATKSKVQIRFADKTKLCQCVNISAQGVAIATGEMNLKVDDKVELRFILNIGEITKLHSRVGIVRYVLRGITGFAMESVSPNYRRRV
jgi:hypothetical protein